MVGRILRVVGWAALHGLCLSCGGATREFVPQVHVASTTGAQAEWAEIQQGWLRFQEERERLGPMLERYVARHPNDDSIPLARVYLAVLAESKNQGTRALQLIAMNAQDKVGTAFELGEIVRARIDRKKGKATEALARIRPLIGKVVDSVGEELLLEEAVLCSMGAHLDFEALVMMDAWLEGATPENRDTVRARIGGLLKNIPESVLDPTYRLMRAKGRASGYSIELRKIVGARLAEIALERGDSNLARALLDGATDLARTPMEAIEELAASSKGIRAVNGRTLGVVLPMTNASSRDEAAEAIRGLAWAFGMPMRNVARPIRLVTRDAGGTDAALDNALEELAGEGASLIVAGFDPESAQKALLWGETTGISVITLVQPKKGTRFARGATLGLPPGLEMDALYTWLARDGASSVRVVSSLPLVQGALAWAGPIVSCDTPDLGASQYRFPVRESSASWLVNGPSECARELSIELGGAYKKPNKPLVALTLEAGIPPRDVRIEHVRFLSVATGLVPVLARTPEEATDDDVRSYMKAFGVRPSYWAALGRDAGALAKNALGPLPDNRVTDDTSIYQRRAIVEAGLLASELAFWTSESRGLDKARELPRVFRSVRFEGGR